MPLMKTSELEGVALNWAVAECEGFGPDQYIKNMPRNANGKVSYILVSINRRYVWWNPSKDWAQGGQIIEREGIDLYCNTVAQPNSKDPAWRVGSWRARICSMSRNGQMHYGPTPLISACRSYVASKFGDEIDLPEYL